MLNRTGDVLDFEILIKLCQSLINKLSAIVDDNCVWYTITANDVFPHESLGLLGRDGG